ncbi:MAG: NYN domain-containing protein [bacterium]
MGGPHSSGPDWNSNPNARKVILVLDLENFSLSLKGEGFESVTGGEGLLFSPAGLLNVAREVGHVIRAMAFADASRLTIRQRDLLHGCGIEVIDCPRLRRDKDTADPNIISLLGFLARYVIFDTLIFASLDRDFIPAIQDLRNQGQAVLILKPANRSSSDLIGSADGFMTYEDLVDSEDSPLKRASDMLGRKQFSSNGDMEAFLVLVRLRQIVNVLLLEMRLDTTPLNFWAMVRGLKKEGLFSELDWRPKDDELRHFLSVLRRHGVLVPAKVFPPTVTIVDNGQARKFFLVDTYHGFVLMPLKDFTDQLDSSDDVVGMD